MVRVVRWWSASFLTLLRLVPSWAIEPELIDVYSTLQARKLIYEDEVLGPLNLGVRVKNRVAVLWGPVGSTELSLRAEARLRTMIELMDVRNEMRVEGDESVFPAPKSAPKKTPLYLPDGTPPAPMVPLEKRSPVPALDAPGELLGSLLGNRVERQ